MHAGAGLHEFAASSPVALQLLHRHVLVDQCWSHNVHASLDDLLHGIVPGCKVTQLSIWHQTAIVNDRFAQF